MKSNNTHKLTLAALFSALAVVSLYLASVWPTGQLGVTAVASLFVAAAVIESGTASGISVFAVSSVIAFLIVPNRMPLVLYALFLGYYPVVKSLLEKRGHVVLQIVCKLIVFNLALTTVWLFFRSLVFDSGDGGSSVRVFFFGEHEIEPVYVFLLGSVVFLVYDYGFSKLVRFYAARIAVRRPR